MPELPVFRLNARSSQPWLADYAKSEVPYSEFLWADFLRPQISLKLIVQDFETATTKALKIAHGPSACHLSGSQHIPFLVGKGLGAPVR